MDLNFREENVDRFLEIMAWMNSFIDYDNRPLFTIINMPKGYFKIIKELGLDFCLVGFGKAKFIVECSKCVHLKHVLVKRASIEDLKIIKARIEKYDMIETEMLDPASEALLTNAAEKLVLSTDQVIDCIRLAHVIASMENSEIKCQHIAEAIQYLKKTL